MSDNNDELLFEDDDFEFAPEEELAEDSDIHLKQPDWKLLIVDDEGEVHNTTKLVLSDFSFDGRGLQFLHAYSGEEAKKVIREHDDIAVILLDVVMETPHAGLDFAKWIREEEGNRPVRIVLRTGQPGHAPERKVIQEYDINDYKQKVELTSQRLFTTVYTAIRSYRDIHAIEVSKKGLRHIIEASSELFRMRSLHQLAQGALTQLTSLFGLNSAMYIRSEGFTMRSKGLDDLEMLAATGRFESCTSIEAASCPHLTREIIEGIEKVMAGKRGMYHEGNYIAYFPTATNCNHLLFIEQCPKFKCVDEDLLQLFSNNVGAAYDNVYLNREVQATQKEFIHRLADVVDTRTSSLKEKAFSFTKLARDLAKACGLGNEQADSFALTVAMHDVGKMVIPESILLKADKLSPDEFDIVKTHTTLGHEILSDSQRPLLRQASAIALEHHENWDGSGYPKGLKGEDISLEGRIARVLDVYDALQSERPYRAAWQETDVISYIQANKGTLFDPTVVDAFVAIHANRDES